MAISFKCSRCGKVVTGRDECDAEVKFDNHKCSVKITKDTPLFLVKLSACQNPDHAEKQNLPKPTSKVVLSYKEASEACRAFINEYDLGAGNWKGGQIFNQGNTQVAYVSYNGKVWDMQNKEITM